MDLKWQSLCILFTIKHSVFNDYFKYSSLQHNHIRRAISNENLYLQ